MGKHSLVDLPTEIHHTIFEYLDYVRDICCDQYLSFPSIEMPLTLEEFEHFNNVEEFVDFEHPNKIPFFLACRSLLKSVKSFRPKMLNLSVLVEKNLSRCYVDRVYNEMLRNIPWFRGSRDAYIALYDLTENFEELLKKMQRFCKANPFSKIEFISFSPHVGRNYSINGTGYGNHYFPYFERIYNHLPSVKYALFQFQHTKPNEKFKNVTIIYAAPSDFYHSKLAVQNNMYYTSPDFEGKEATPIENLKNVFPNNYPTNIEIFLYNYIMSNNYQEVDYIINNFRIDIRLFSYQWNVKSDIRKEIKIDSLKQIMDMLNNIYQKYPSFRVFKIPIDNIENMKLILSYPFVDINVGNNLTKVFLSSINETDIQPLYRDYNIDLSKLGCYKFSAACFVEASTLPVKKSSDIFGVSTYMLTRRLDEKININERDKYGNNILHYLTIQPNYNLNYSEFLSEDEIKILGQEPNSFGVTPNEIVILNRVSSIKVKRIHNKLNYEGLFKVGINFPSLVRFDGLIMNEKTLSACIENLQPNEYNYNEYKDINYRDVNGKHLVHYSYFSFSNRIPNLLGIALRDVVYCKDVNGTVPIQTWYENYQQILENLGKFENMPKMNFISYSDNFGMYRFLYLLFQGVYINTHLLVNEANSFGFDYSSGQPELVSLCSHYLDGCYQFTIEKSPLQQLRGVKYFGCIDGDDFSHYVIRFYLTFIKNNPPIFLDTSIILALTARGLKFDVVKNSEGQTAFDLLNLFNGTNIDMTQLKKVKKACRKGMTTKSKALPKFSLQHKEIREELIVEKSDTRLILKTNSVSSFNIGIKRRLYFKQGE